jgi:hypothetical protein
MLGWEIHGVNDDGTPIKMKDGRPFAMFKNYTLSWSDKATLRIDLQAWRGRPFTAEEMRRFDLKTILGAWCMLNVIEKPGTDGKIYIESATTLLAEGFMRTGYVRYNTLENKIFKLLQPRIDTTNGAFDIESIDANGTPYNIGTFAQGDSVPEVNVNYPVGAQQYLGFRFTMYRSSTNSALGPLFTGYQIKALPAIPRQRLIQYPVMCYDHEMDKFNNEVGYEGSAYARMAQLESVENAGDTIRVEDFRTGESYIGLIEEMDFINKTPTDKRFTGFGGLLLVTIRSV